MKLHLAARVAAALLAMASAQAGASSASASMSGFRIELVDLDPADGIAPSVVFQDVQGGTFVAAETGVMGAGGQLVRATDMQSGSQVFGSAVASRADASSAAFATMAGDPFGAGGNVSASASSTLHDTYGASTVMLGDGAPYAPFTLSPETRVVITADASTTASSSVDDPWASIWASAFLKLADFTGQGEVSFASARSEQGSTHGAAPTVSGDDEHLEVTFDNLSGVAIDGLFSGSVDTYAGDIAPVPEPGDVALMLGALAVFGWRARRRTLRG